MAKFKIIPTEDYLVCSRYSVEHATQSGILLPSTSRDLLAIFKVEESTSVDYPVGQLILVKELDIDMEFDGKAIIEKISIVGNIEFAD